MLQCVDQEQTGSQTVSRARTSESADGDALGLPHLQPAALDPLEEASHGRRKLGRKREENPERSARTTTKNSHSDLLNENTMTFFTASYLAKGAVFEFSLHSIHTTALTVYY